MKLMRGIYEEQIKGRGFRARHGLRDRTWF